MYYKAKDQTRTHLKNEMIIVKSFTIHGKINKLFKNLILNLLVKYKNSPNSSYPRVQSKQAMMTKHPCAEKHDNQEK